MWRIPLSDLNYDEQEELAVLEVVRSRWLSMGPKTEQFESAAAAYLGARHAIAVTNCTCALELAYAAAFAKAFPDNNLPRLPLPGVIVPTMTFVATANAALMENLQPIFAGTPSAEVPLLDVADVKSLLAQSTSGIVALTTVHYAGFDSESEAIRDLAHSHEIMFIEDAAHAIGGKSAAGQQLGTVGDIGCFSFFSNKNLATGEGGLVVTNDDDLARHMKLLRSHGMTRLTFERHSSRSHGYDVLMPGHNYRCTELMAALALEQLKKLDAGNARRRDLFRLYQDHLRHDDLVSIPMASDQEALERSACHILPLLCATSGIRDTIRAALDTAGIQTSHHYSPVHTLTYFAQSDSARDKRPSLKNAEEFASRELTLPLHPLLKDVEVEEICSVISLTLKEMPREA